MKIATLSLISLLAIAASSQAAVTARCIAITTTGGELSVGTPLDLVSTDGHRVSYRATRSFNSLYDYRTTITLRNPLLALGQFRHMKIKIVGRTTTTTTPMRIMALKPVGAPELIAVQPMATFDRPYTYTIIGNVRRFIAPNGVVRLHLFAFSPQPFAQRFDEVSATFF